jgi:sugar lactone lactonase YvrE/pimeloyl-ACP methyl ester carboxylesterase
VVHSFDAARSELPEGIAIDMAGNIYVSLGPPLFVGGGFGEIWRISPDGTETTLAQFEGGPPAAGLAVDASANLYYAYPSGEEDTQGVYRLSANGDTERLPGTEAIVLANGLAFDNDGNLYVSDSVLGIIWRIPPGGSAEPWLQHELLAGCPPDNPFGANGVALGEGKLYAANTAKGLLVRVPILSDGSAGEPENVAGVDECDEGFDDLDAMDGIALDVDGNIYAPLVMQNKLVRIDPTDGSVTVLLTGDDGLHNPASIVFGTGKDNQESVFLTNYAVLPPEPPASPGPAVLKFDVSVAGLPLPAPETASAPAPTQAVHREEIQVAYDDRVIRGTLLGEGDTVVILAPGFGVTRGIWMEFARHFASLGYAAVAFDFPGFGASTGPFNWSKINSDVTALIDYLQQERGFERIVCMGVSIGGSTCFEAAKDVPILAGLVILSSPLKTTTPEEVTELTMPKLLVIGTEPDEARENVNGPMREVYKLLPDPKQFESIRQRGSTLLTAGDELRDLLVAFLESLK